MPDAPRHNPRPHPFRAIAPEASYPHGPSAQHRADYAELAVTTNYTFLTGASHPEEYVERAALLGHAAASIADTNTLAGIVRAHVAAKEAGIPLAIGSRLVFVEPDGLALIAYPMSRGGYANLCRLLTLGKRRVPKGECRLVLDDLVSHQEGMLCIALPPPVIDDSFARGVGRLRTVFDDDRLSLAMSRSSTHDDAERTGRIAATASSVGVPLVAINDVHYHAPERRELQDVLTCIRHGVAIEHAGFRLHPNAERHLKPADEMMRLFAEYPAAVARSVELARRASAFGLDELRYEYPAEPCPEGTTPTAYLSQLAHAGAAERYPGGVPEKVAASLEYELNLIAELRYEAYFLTCADLVAFARSRGILCQGRGGAANSAVCFCLGITEVDPARFSLLFERFISRARKEPPDIDIDFEHERREEVLQYLYAKYGRERAALTAEVIRYRGRSAVRDVGKAMGLSIDAVDTLAKAMDHWGEAPSVERACEAGFNPDDPIVRRVVELSSELIGFPRHLSQHVGGMVMTRTPLCELVPIENAAMDDRTVIEWDKDDIDAMGMLKVDCLGLGMLTCIRKCFEFLEEHRAERLTLAGVPHEDPGVYAMIQRADTIGVFQIESRAQMSMLPRLRPANFYDLVIEVAIVRPGPIQGDMVHPYLRRRNGEEPVVFPSREIEAVLARTLGVPLFQEQAMQLAIVAAGFTPDEADALRRAMAAWKRKGKQIETFGAKLISGMTARGYPAEFARRCFEQIKGFSEYGFPESHAASFALLVYVSSWLKRYRHAAFAAALINSQPMGFYAPAQIVRDAQDHGVEVRPIDANHSAWDCTLEDGGRVLRLGMRLVKGMRQADAGRIAAGVREHGAFTSIDRLWRASGAPVAALRALARADGFRSIGLDRQQAIWHIRALRDQPMPLFDLESTDAGETIRQRETTPALPQIDARRHVIADVSNTGLSLKAHPLSFLRERLSLRGVSPAGDLRDAGRFPNGRPVRVAGLVLVRQRPGTASGIVFVTLEDETGIANLIVMPQVFERFRKAARTSTILLANGRIERQGEVVHVKVSRIESLDAQWESLPSRSRDFH